jgi:hypothetical protein
MSGTWTSMLTTLMRICVLGSLSIEAQSASATATARERRPDLSGRWILVEALVSGSTRGSEETSAPRRTSSNTISGAAFNCGRECTIAQKGPTLTIQDAELADYPGKDKSRPPPPVTLQMDGDQRSVVDSFSPNRELPVTAKWQGNKLEITSGTGSLVQTQLLSREGKQLVVVNVSQVNGERRSEVTFKYRKK